VSEYRLLEVMERVRGRFARLTVVGLDIREAKAKGQEGVGVEERVQRLAKREAWAEFREIKIINCDYAHVALT